MGRDLVFSLMNLAPFVAMLLLEFTDVGMTTLSKAAMREGMNSFVFVTCFNLLATFLLLPIIIFRWKQTHLTFSLFSRLAILGLLGSLFQILNFTGIKLSSPTLSAATGNLEPVFTILLALMLRIEKVNLYIGLAMSMGSAICVLGALMVTLYKGSQVLQFIILPSSSSSYGLFNSIDSSWIIGGIILSISWIISALWHILQTITIVVMPDRMITLFIYVLFSTIGSGIFSLCIIRDPREWVPKSHIEIVAVVYTAILGLVVKKFIHIWCLQVRGPIFVTIFRPLRIAIAMVMGVLFLGDSLYVGRIIGAIIIAVGFYIVMWGKAKQQQQHIYQNEVHCPESVCENMNPLLENISQEELERQEIKWLTK